MKHLKIISLFLVLSFGIFGGIYLSSSSYEKVANSKAVNHLCLGGTFDHLHKGHRTLLKRAHELTKKRIVIGITSQEMVKKKRYSYLIESFETRKKNVLAYLKSLGLKVKVEIVKLRDKKGPAASDKNLEGLLLSSETFKVAEFINKERLKNGMNSLKVFVIPRNPEAESSTKIRKEIAKELNMGSKHLS